MACAGLDGSHEVLGGKMIGARTGHQQTIPVNQLQRELIELAIRRLSLRDVLLALDKGRWIENHDVEALPLGVQRLQGIESVLTDGFELYAIIRGIALSKVQ